MKTNKTYLTALLVLPLLCSAAMATVVKGSYSVPVTSDLAAFASNPTDFDVSVDATGQVALSYNLPSELVGDDTYTVKLKQNPDSKGDLVQLSSDSCGDTASCLKTDSLLTCLVRYPGLVIDDKAVDQTLKSEFTDSDQLANRTKVSRRFASEPVGIVYAPLK